MIEVFGLASRRRRAENHRTGMTAEPEQARDTAKELRVDVHVFEIDLREHRRRPRSHI
ncbi:MAG: hypothetical protein JJ855_06550 [Rhodospirillales bacterium]|nr:hypothetical protein [Rhodospirillales bacterium]